MKRMALVLLVPFSLSLIPLVSQADVRHFAAHMAPMNDSGVSATVTMTLTDGKTLSVSVDATGMVPGQPHPQHIHGHDAPKADATCPTADADANGDGNVDVGEGLPDYGPIVLPLVPFNLVDAGGNLGYDATFTINPGDLQPLHKRAVVLHGGFTVGGSYVPSLPIACGQIEEVF